MRVCIVGAKERDTAEDEKYVVDLMEAIKGRTPNVIFVTMLTHMGVGKFIREVAKKTDAQGRHKYLLIDASVRVYAPHLSKSEVADIYLARNATPFEMSDMLYYLAAEDRRGPMENLLQRFADAGRPCKVLLPGDAVEVL